MPVRVMSNPAQLLLAGNPRKKRRAVKRAATSKKPSPEIRYVMVSPLPNPSKGKPVSNRRKSKKSPAARAARATKRKQKRANRRKGMPAGLKRYWAKKNRKAKSSTKPRKQRRARKSRKARLHRRRSKARRRIKTVFASAGARVVVRKVRRGSARKPTRKQRRSARRVGTVGVNAGALSLTGGITDFFGNAKATMKDGVKGFAFAFGGAAGAVAGGAFMSRLTNGVVGQFAPSLLSNPIVARLLGAVNYYLPGWALSKFVPGLSGKSRRAMLTGAAAAALVEVIRPGMIRNLMVRVPVIGGLMGMAEDQADGVGAYVAYALSGDNHTARYSEEDLIGMGDYVEVDGDAAQNVGVAGMGEYVAY